jgi:hypothetical protein
MRLDFWRRRLALKLLLQLALFDADRQLARRLD